MKTTTYKGRLVMLGPRDEAALSLIRNDLTARGYKASRSSAIRYALHSLVQTLIADIAGAERLPAPAAIAMNPTVMSAPAGEEGA